jgi:DNA mismatch repair protein MutL
MYRKTDKTQTKKQTGDKNLGKINILDISVYNKIAAGEVIERPASVVKELVENSIDARATEISVAILEGGLLSIEVTDNGTGIDREDALKAFLPHATSKIKNADDLFEINSLGFRGEALYTIAAVSKVELKTKTSDSDTGVLINISADEKQLTDVGAVKGTSVTVKRLFYNTPARLKFLKKPRYETAEITNLMSRLIIANPDIKFNYEADGALIFKSGGKSLRESIFTVYGNETVSNLIEVKDKYREIEIFGYIGTPDFVKPNKTYQTLIINGRYVVNGTVSSAAHNAYKQYLMTRTYPFYVLNLIIPKNMLDVNVHPNKLDVRFSDNQAVYGAVFNSVSRALNKADGDCVGIKDFFTDANKKAFDNRSFSFVDYGGTLREIDNAIKNFYNDTTERGDENEVATGAAAPNNNDSARLGGESKPTAGGNGGEAADFYINDLDKKFGAPYAATPPFESSAQPMPYAPQMELKPEVKILGQLFNTYIIIEYYDRLCIIDQHAAHERLLYDKYKKQSDDNMILVQTMLTPYVINVNSSEYEFLEGALDFFKSSGFEITPFGNYSFSINAVPLLLSGLDINQFFMDFLKNIKGFSGEKLSDAVKDCLMQKACKAAVKAGDILSKNEIEILLKQTNESKLPLKCPHGRPIIKDFSKTDVEKWFKRIV